MTMAEEELQSLLRDGRAWGRWGPDDQRGAVNLITDDARRRAAGLVRDGRVVSLARPLPTAPGPAVPVPTQHAMKRGRRGDAGYAVDHIALPTHGVGYTHLDALCHVWGADGMWNGRDPDAEIGFDGSRWADVDQFGDGIVTRGVLLDVPRHRGAPYVTADEPVSGDELAAIAGALDDPIEPGDAVVVHCGRDAWEREHGPWGAPPPGSAVPTGVEDRPGLDASCLRFLRDVDPAVLVWDMMDAQPTPPGMPWTVHAVLYAFGIALVDNARLDALATACADAGRSDFLLMVAPLRLVGGTGSPVNPLALL